jgi:hypothetical protein
LPDWLAPPENVEPATVYVDLVVATGDALTLSITLLKVFREGLSFDLACHGEYLATHPFFEGPPLICEWTSRGIAETGASIDGALLAQAAGRCRELWDDTRDLPPTEEDVVI